jgi:hypothetical protein
MTVMAAVMTAVMTATHSSTTLTPAACGSFGRDKRSGADGGDRGNSENRLAYHGSLLWLCWMCFSHPAWSVGQNDTPVRQSGASESQIDYFVMAITAAKAWSGILLAVSWLHGSVFQHWVFCQLVICAIRIGADDKSRPATAGEGVRLVK